MAGKPLFGTPFSELLPDSIRDVPEIAAAAQALDVMFYYGDAEIANVLIWSRVDGLEEPFLSNLAYQMHLEGYEGWHLAETPEQKRSLLKESVKLHFHKGTRWSLERVFEILDMRGLVTEWWEASDDPDFKPFEFDMDIEIARAISEGFFKELLELIDALKNLRSHLRKARVYMVKRAKLPVVATAVMSGMFMALRPFYAQNLEVAAPLPTTAAIYKGLHGMTLKPLGDNA